QILSAEAGSHRFVWDLHYTPLNLPSSYPMGAIYKNTAPAPTSPWVMPGNYIVRLKVNGQIFSQPLVIKMDPRVKTSLGDLQKQHDLSMLCYEGRLQINKISRETVRVHNQIKELTGKSQNDLHASLSSLDEKITNIENAKPHDKLKSFNDVYNSFASLFNLLQESDMPPTKSTIEAVNSSEKNFKQLEEAWMKIKTIDIPKINNELKKEKLSSVVIEYDYCK
ncbi:MAG: glycoside hydrolase, partial [Bacteroidia bacterium]